MASKLLGRLSGEPGTAKTAAKSKSAKKGPRAAGEDAFALLIRYVKQETLGPLQGLGRYVAIGLGGSILLGIGVLLLLVALLRVLQTETGTTFAGNLSWVPYCLVAIVAILVVVFAVLRISRGPAKTKRTPSTSTDNTSAASTGLGATTNNAGAAGVTNSASNAGADDGKR